MPKEVASSAGRGAFPRLVVFCALAVITAARPRDAQPCPHSCSCRGEMNFINCFNTSVAFLETLDEETRGQIMSLALVFPPSTRVDIPPNAFASLNSLQHLLFVASNDFVEQSQFAEESNVTISIHLQPGSFAGLGSLRMLASRGVEFEVEANLWVRDIGSIFGDLKNSTRVDALQVFDTNAEFMFRFGLTKGLVSEWPGLRRLTLKNNPMRAGFRTVESDALAGTEALTWLDLSYCAIETIELGAFDRLQNLLHLDLSNNLLPGLSQGAFAHHMSLEELRLQNNQISELAVDLLANAWNLRILDLGGNRLHKLSPDTFRFNGRLSDVILDGNQLVALPADITGTPEGRGRLSLLDNPLDCRYVAFVRGLGPARLSRPERVLLSDNASMSCGFHGDFLATWRPRK